MPSRSGNGGGLSTLYDGTQPTSKERYSTGSPKGRAGEAVQPRFGDEPLIQNFAHMISPGARPSTKRMTLEDDKL